VTNAPDRPTDLPKGNQLTNQPPRLITPTPKLIGIVTSCPSLNSNFTDYPDDYPSRTIPHAESRPQRAWGRPSSDTRKVTTSTVVFFWIPPIIPVSMSLVDEKWIMSS